MKASCTPPLSNGAGAPGMPSARAATLTLDNSAAAKRRAFVIFMSGLLRGVARLSASADSEREGERADEDGALHEILGVVGHVQHRQSVEKDADEDRAGDRAEHVRVAPVQHREADQRGCDAVEQQGGAREDVATSDARRDEDPAERAEYA